MTTLSANTLTLGDRVRRSNPDGTIVSMITETMDQFNGMSNDARWFEGELPGGHQGTYRSSLPAWATINPNGTGGTAKSTTGQNLETTEYIQAIMEFHEIVGNYGGDVSGLQASETPAFVQGGMQTVSSRLIYGNGTTTPGQITGIMARYNSLTTGNNARNVVDGGALAGQTDCMSVLFMDWGQGKVSGFYPQGSKGGFEMVNHGRRIKDVSATTQQVVYTIQFKQGIGLAVDNWTSVVRVANIDKSLLVAGTGADLFDKFIVAKHKLSRGAASKTRGIYLNSTTDMMLDIQARNDVIAGGGLTYINVNGEDVKAWRGIPLNIEDQLTESETVVS